MELLEEIEELDGITELLDFASEEVALEAGVLMEDDDSGTDELDSLELDDFRSMSFLASSFGSSAVPARLEVSEQPV